MKISTTQLARVVHSSQQTASRQLIQLEKTGLVERHFNVNGGWIRITENGMDELRRVYLNLKTVMEGSTPTLKLEGTVFQGFQEGAYYVSQKGYRRQFVEKLGFDPYPGTLNIRLRSKVDFQTRKELEAYPAILIEGFGNEHRSFGPLRCYRVTINGQVQGALMAIQRTHYDSSVVELIAPVKLREKLNLKDGDKVVVEAFISGETPPHRT